MKSRPMIFSAPMVRALLADKKTQTRRVVKPQPPENWMSGDVAAITNGKLWAFSNTGWAGGKRGAWPVGDGIKCPYGVVGDRLWVRETYAHLITDQCPWRYKATDNTSMYEWKSSMFMPRHASRIELEITGIRVERVQDITDADALAEGVEVSDVERGLCAEEEYSVLWTQIHGYDEQKGWNANPWVWVVEFKVVKS